MLKVEKRVFLISLQVTNPKRECEEDCAVNFSGNETLLAVSSSSVVDE